MGVLSKGELTDLGFEDEEDVRLVCLAALVSLLYACTWLLWSSNDKQPGWFHRRSNTYRKGCP